MKRHMQIACVVACLALLAHLLTLTDMVTSPEWVDQTLRLASSLTIGYLAYVAGWYRGMKDAFGPTLFKSPDNRGHPTERGSHGEAHQPDGHLPPR